MKYEIERDVKARQKRKIEREKMVEKLHKDVVHKKSNSGPKKGEITGQTKEKS